jgi:hypothetical protein
VPVVCVSELLSELVSEEKSQQVSRPSGSEPTSAGSVSCIIEPGFWVQWEGEIKCFGTASSVCSELALSITILYSIPEWFVAVVRIINLLL